MTARELVNSPGAKLLLWGISFGIAYATLTAQVQQKADKTEVADIRTSLQQMARDVKVLRAIACQQAKADSFCQGQP